MCLTPSPPHRRHETHNKQQQQQQHVVAPPTKPTTTATTTTRVAPTHARAHLVELDLVEEVEQLAVLLVLLKLDVLLRQPVQGELGLVVNVNLHRLLRCVLKKKKKKKKEREKENGGVFWNPPIPSPSGRVTRDTAPIREDDDR
jgi:hypothetical protein